MSRVFLFLLLCFSVQVQAVPDWHWEDHFSREECEALKDWVMHAEQGMANLLGPLPFEYRVFFHRRHNSDEPVPWARTDKHSALDVYFHVDTTFPWNAFREDWTAPHELTHLVFPYIHDEGRWFAEGIASYLQYQVMYANDTITWAEGMAEYRDRFKHAVAQGPIDMSIVDLSMVAGELGAYVRLYWGGAAFFMQADKRLYEEKGMRLNDVIRIYMHHHHGSRGSSVKRILEIFDYISDSTVFTKTYNETVMQPRFPEYEDALAWLAKHPPERTIVGDRTGTED